MAISPGSLGFQQLATDPPAPPAGYCIIYSKTDNVLYLRDSSGVIIPLGSSSSITSLTGDVTATGPGAAATTVVQVGGKLAAAIATAVQDVEDAVSTNTPSTLVFRDASGNFAANIITASLSGNADTATTAIDFSGSLVGDVSGTQSATVVDTVGGSSAADIHTAELAANAATNTNTASTIVKRDALGDFSAGTITANITGNVSGSASTFTTALSGDVSGNQSSTIVGFVGGSSAANVHSAELAANAATNSNTASTIVKRDASGNFTAGTITADLLGNATTSDTFTGSLTGDVSSVGMVTTVDTVGGKTSAEVATSVDDTQAATDVNTPSTIVKRDASGDFAAGNISAENGLTVVGDFVHGNTAGQETSMSKVLQQQSTMGLMSGGVISYLGLNVTVTAGTGYVSIGSHPTDYLQYTTWSTQTISVSANSATYLYIDASGTLAISLSLPNTYQNVFIGKVLSNGTSVYLIQPIANEAYHIGNQLHDFIVNALGPVYVTGSIVSENSTPRRLDVTSGQYYYGTHEFNPSAGLAIFFTEFYRNGLGGYIKGSTTQDLASSVNNWQYDNNSGGLVLIPATKFAKHSLYIVNDGANQQYFLVYAQAFYDSLVQAEAALLPTPPPFFNANMVLIASIVVGQGLPLQQIRDERPVVQYKASGISASAVHGNLLGLSADDHPQYFRTDGTRLMTGDIEVNNNDINGADLIKATSGLTVQSGSYVGEYQSQQVILTDPASIQRSKITLGRIDLQDSGGITGTIRQDGGDLNFSISGSGQFKFNGQKVGQIGNGVASDDAVAIGQFSHSNLFYVATNGNNATADGSFPKPFQTIAAAVAAAPSNSTIQLFPGNYTEATVVLPDQIVIKGMGEGVTNVTNGFSHTSTAASISLLLEDLTYNSLTLNATSALNGTIKIRCSAGLLNRSDNNNNVLLTMTESNLFGGTINGTNNFSEVLVISAPTIQNGLNIFENSKLVAKIEAEGTAVVRMLDCELFGPTDFINGTIVSGNTPTWEVDFSSSFLGGYTGSISKTLLGTVDMLGDVTGTQNSTIVSYVNGKTALEVSTSVDDTQAATDLNTPSTIVKRDASGNFNAGTITANITGDVSGSAATFTGSLSGDVSGGQSSTSVDKVGGKTSAEIATSVDDTQAATDLNNVSTIVKRDGSGNFSAGTITANITGNVSGSSSSFTGLLSGDVSGGQSSVSVNTVGGKGSAEISVSVTDTQQATNLNTVSTIVKRDSSGNFSAGTITASLTGAASANLLKAGDSMTGYFRSAVVALTDGATINTDVSLGNTFSVTLGGNRTLAAPTGMATSRQKITYIIKQDATGGRTLTFNAAFNFGLDLTGITLSTTPNATDYIGAIYNPSTSKWDVIAITRGY